MQTTDRILVSTKKLIQINKTKKKKKKRKEKERQAEIIRNLCIFVCLFIEI